MRTRTLGLLILLSFCMMGWICEDDTDCTDLFNKLSQIATDANQKLGQIGECKASSNCSDGQMRLLKAEFEALRAVYGDVLGEYVAKGCEETVGEPVPFPDPGETLPN